MHCIQLSIVHTINQGAISTCTIRKNNLLYLSCLWLRNAWFLGQNWPERLKVLGVQRWDGVLHFERWPIVPASENLSGSPPGIYFGWCEHGGGSPNSRCKLETLSLGAFRVAEHFWLSNWFALIYDNFEIQVIRVWFIIKWSLLVVKQVKSASVQGLLCITS